MVCARCRQAAVELTAGDEDEAVLQHAACPGGTWCDCQHVIRPATGAQA